jgi:4-amino-4-deoxy-L-arabinose transferase-like glycosyltransferase
MNKRMQRSPLFYFILALLLALPAFFINLGKQPVIDDEAIRALVAFEMVKTGDYITPSIAGELYLKKPPLYNWLITLSFHALDRSDEFAVRLPMILSLLLFCLVIFYYFRKEMNLKFAVLSALMFLTCGRILIYESLHGLIDITYSLLIFVFFMHIYRSFMQGNLPKLFLIGYVIIAFSFLMKGLPSLAFLGITLLVLFISQKRFRMLFHWSHFVGVGLFIAITGSYYVLYFLQNEVPVQQMLEVFFGESSRRTVVKFGFWPTVLHIISYPADVFYHFLPWTFIVILLFQRGMIRKIKKQPFIRYLSLVLLFNIIIYWTSPEVFPRYILMLIPLLFGVLVFAYQEQKADPTVFVRIVEWTFGVLLLLAAFTGLAAFFVDVPLTPAETWVFAVSLTIVLGVIAFFYFRDQIHRLMWLVIALLVLRIAFNFTVIPARLVNSQEIESKEMARDLIKRTNAKTTGIWWNKDFKPNPYYGYRITSYRFNYYLFLFKDEVLPITQERETDRLYISPVPFVEGENVERYHRCYPPGQGGSELVLFRFLPPVEATQ